MFTWQEAFRVCLVLTMLAVYLCYLWRQWLNRSSAPDRTVKEPGEGTLEIWSVPNSEDALWRLYHDIFTNWWQQIRYGILVQGGVQEFRPLCAPTTSQNRDGYATFAFGEAGHLHLCIGPTTGEDYAPTPPAVARIRQPGRTEFYRKLDKNGHPVMWALRAFNSKWPTPAQTITIFFPNPLLTEKGGYAVPPDWTKLQAWNCLRKEHLGLDEDPKDRLATRFSHD